MSPYFHQLQSHSTPDPHKSQQQSTIPQFALMKSQRSKRQLSKSFTVVIRPLSIHLIKPNFEVKVRQSLVGEQFLMLVY